MADEKDLSLTSVRIEEENERYRFTVLPLLHSGESVALYQERSKSTFLKEWSVAEEMAGTMTIEKGVLQGRAYAYLAKKRGSERGTPVRILMRQPDVRQILLMAGGKIGICIATQDEYSAAAGLQIEIWKEEQQQALIRLQPGEREFDLAQAGIVSTQEGLIGFRIRFYTEDENHSRVTGVRRDVDLVLNPPAVVRVVREESQIILGLAQAPKQPLYARICQDGRPVYTLPCESNTDGKGGERALYCNVDSGGQAAIDYVISTEQLNLPQDACTVEIACRNAWTVSYWSEPVPVLLKRPVIERIQAQPEVRTIRMGECGYYFWQDQYKKTDRITVGDKKVPEIRYADRYASVVSLSQPARVPERIEHCFYLREGCYRLTEAEMVCPLQESYEKEYQNNSFQIRIGKDKGASLHIFLENKQKSVQEDFQGLLEAVCHSYAQLEELTGCFGHMPLMAKDMLGIRYGYDIGDGYCDLHAGMELCFDYEQYQNIPEGRQQIKKNGCEITEQELSGFTGSGSSMFPCVLREGRITFEPFAQGMSQDMGFSQAAGNGRGFGMVIDAPEIGEDGHRIGLAAGIWDALFTEFSRPFVRLLCPQDWKRSENKNYGSVNYFDHICLAAADTYQDLARAADCYYQRKAMLEGVYYICFRGRTAIRIMIHIFVEGHPQICTLGTTLGDIAAAYGLGSGVRLQRYCEGWHVPFMEASMDIPLYIGDRICSV